MNAAAANPRTAVCRAKIEYCAHWERLAFAVENIFPEATAKQLSHLCGLKVRACFTFLARKSGLSSDALVPMLRSRHGPAVLRALIGDDCREPWYVEFQIMIRRMEVEQFERDMRGIDDDYAAQAPAARHHQTVRSMGQAGASTAAAKAPLLKGQSR